MGPPPALDGWLKRLASARSRSPRPQARSQARPPRPRSCRALARLFGPPVVADDAANRARAGRPARPASDVARVGFRGRRAAEWREPRSHPRSSRGEAHWHDGARSARAPPRHRPTKHGPRKLVASAAMLTAPPAAGEATEIKLPYFARSF